MNLQDNDSTASMRDLMTADPVRLEDHEDNLRRIVEARRRMEDVREAAKARAVDPLDIW